MRATRRGPRGSDPPLQHVRSPRHTFIRATRTPSSRTCSPRFQRPRRPSPSSIRRDPSSHGNGRCHRRSQARPDPKGRAADSLSHRHGLRPARPGPPGEGHAHLRPQELDRDLRGADKRRDRCRGGTRRIRAHVCRGTGEARATRPSSIARSPRKADNRCTSSSSPPITRRASGSWTTASTRSASESARSSASKPSLE